MRKLMWFAIGYAVAVFTFAYLMSGSILLLMAALSGVLCAIFLLLRRKMCKVIALMLLGVSFGAAYCWGYEQTVLLAAKQLDGCSVDIHMEATDYSFETGYGNAVDGIMDIDGRRYKTRLYYQNEESVQPGDKVTAQVRFRFTPSGGMENTTYHKGEGIFLLAYCEEDIAVEAAGELPGKYLPSHLRRIIGDRIGEIFPEHTSAFAKALLLGDDSDLSYRDNIAFQKSGIRHIIAVSGLHISILFSVIYFVTGRKSLLILLLGLPVLFLFAAVAGFTPSVVRACIMQALVIVSVAVNKEYDPPTSLAFAVLLMLLSNPLTVTSVSFQLSVGSMIGIFAFSGKIRDYLYADKRLGQPNGKRLKARLKRWFVVSVSVSVGAMVITLPLCTAYFETVSISGIIANLLTLWVISFIFCGIMAAALLSAIWMPLGVAVGWVVSVPIQYVLAVARLLANIPFGAAYTQSPYTVLWVVLTVMLVCLFFLLKKRSPGLLTGAVTALYCLSLVMTWAEPRLDSFRMTVLDVGQGQCVLLQSKDEAYLIDCGGDHAERTATAALSAMGAQGIYRLDGLILTHYDVDHAGGAVYLAQALDIETLYLPDTDLDDEIRCGLEQQDIPIQWVRENMSLSCGTGEISIFPAKTESKGNESSMCILFQGENCAILITGDRDIPGEAELCEQAGIPDVDVLVAGHHGASTSTGLELLSKTKPELAIISVGEDNIHDHPHRETIERLERIGCLIRRTDQEGTIIIRG